MISMLTPLNTDLQDGGI